MLSEPILDALAVAFLLVTGAAWLKVCRSWQRTPDNWIGPQTEFDERRSGESRWSTIGALSLLAALLVSVIDLLVN